MAAREDEAAIALVPPAVRLLRKLWPSGFTVMTRGATVALLHRDLRLGLRLRVRRVFAIDLRLP
jgi:hypothetical protein